MLGALAALNGLLAVIVGAFGAHAMTDAQAKAWVATGALYGLGHAAAALTVMARAPTAAWAMSAGAIVFSGTLYLMALGLPRWLGAVTPIGGVLMIAGWALLIWHFLRA
ncbi:DUF423 domain-containing protein [Sphingosinicella soli]|uniref:Uncharacterized membrane protein YgdD (TMEM256/DUF423 family) n=1 Tax=Sphingosinicella soli TaxID=333708 RepID=A0A7W7AZS0_9SPHN|nr:DUF423 domain-containing protein [Sphingosinicella soli]MBB4631390.1 uncharacterized membrane protein YgdD (TMEM256/DUF423 family) [Sphingosinicella soli]